MSNGSIDVMPNVTAVATATNYGRFVIGPVEPGIGTPLGNALRRILLSSLPGSAVTSVRIQNVYHEFSCIPFVREDVTEIVLNVKNIRLRSYSDRSVRLPLSKRGPGEARAGDIDLPANVELVNPELVLATLDSEEAQLDMELTVDRGRGYVSFEAREGLPIGTIPVDAVFSPIPKVNYLVEPADASLLVAGDGSSPEPSTLVGREQVVLEVWTDGTIDPGEALSMSAQYLAQHSSLIATFNRVVEPFQGRDLGGVAIPPQLFEMSIEDLNLSMRTYNCLKRSGVMKVGQVLRMDKKELLGLRNFGDKSYVELYQSLESRDLLLPGTPLAVTAGEPVEPSEGDEDSEDDDELDDLDMDLDMEDVEDDEDDEEEDEDVEGAEDAQVGYASIDINEGHAEPDVFIAESVDAAEEGGTQVVHPAGVSEGSMEMAAGIILDGLPASEPIDIIGGETASVTSAPVGGELAAEVPEDIAPKRARKSRAKSSG